MAVRISSVCYCFRNPRQSFYSLQTRPSKSDSPEGAWEEGWGGFKAIFKDTVIAWKLFLSQGPYMCGGEVSG